MMALAPAPAHDEMFIDDIDATDEIVVDDEIVKVVSLAERAQRFDRQAATMHPLVAGAYRRRAAELRLTAWVRAVRAGVDDPSVVLEVIDDLDDEPLDAA
jgi:hypothetical protein